MAITEKDFEQVLSETGFEKIKDGMIGKTYQLKTQEVTEHTHTFQFSMDGKSVSYKRETSNNMNTAGYIGSEVIRLKNLTVEFRFTGEIDNRFPELDFKTKHGAFRIELGKLK